MHGLPRHLRSLPWLMGAPPLELADRSYYGRAALIAKLARVLAAERRRGLAGHWTYELARHRALLAIYRCEKAAFRRDYGCDAETLRPIVAGPPS
ncbi:MAG TPA: hypothetical protein VNZ50_16210 [Hyphomicrobiaceae bacterium]|nr:hypothetical protein [Hyphomicrobiaceae bacterium]